MKALFWVAVTTVILVLFCIGLGVYEAFLIHLWFGISLTIALLVMITFLILLIIKLVNDIRQWLISIVNKLPKWLKKLLGI